MIVGASWMTLAVGAMLMAASVVLDAEPVFHAGLAATLLAGIGLAVARQRLTDVMLERARQDGYDSGYADGCEVARPFNVVAIERRSSGTGRRLAGSGAAHQLGEQRDLGSTADRIV